MGRSVLVRVVKHGTPLFQTRRRGNRIAFVAQVIFGVWLLAMNAYSGWDDWHAYGGGRTKSGLYGIWNVDELSIDGQLRSPLLTDYDCWHRAVFDFPDSVAFQRMDDSFARCRAAINTNDKTIALTKSSEKNWKANFAFERVTHDRLIVDGKMDTHEINMQLQLVDHSKFMLVSRGFHWIQEYPFNR
jgi:hypothetical protein